MRLLGVLFLVVICLGIAPWGVVAAVILWVGWLLIRPAELFKTDRLNPCDDRFRASDAIISAIPLLNAVYCVNCDLITNSRHDYCGVCGSHSVIAVSRMWQLTLTEAPTRTAKYKVSFTAEVQGIPANELSESTKLIGRLAELGGDVRELHIEVEPVAGNDVATHKGTIELLKPFEANSTSEWPQVRERAS